MRVRWLHKIHFNLFFLYKWNRINATTHTDRTMHKRISKNYTYRIIFHKSSKHDTSPYSNGETEWNMDDANQHIVPRVAIEINSVCVCVCALMVTDYFVSLLYVPNGLIPFFLIKEMFSSSLHILSFLILIFHSSQLFWLSLLTAWNCKKFKLLTFNSLEKSIPHDTFSQNSKP